MDSLQKEKMRVGCGSMVVGGFALDWLKVTDEVIAVDYDITALFPSIPARPVLIQTHGCCPSRRLRCPGYFGIGEGWGGSK